MLNLRPYQLQHPPSPDRKSTTRCKLTDTPARLATMPTLSSSTPKPSGDTKVAQGTVSLSSPVIVPRSSVPGQKGKRGRSQASYRYIAPSSRLAWRAWTEYVPTLSNIALRQYYSARFRCPVVISLGLNWTSPSGNGPEVERFHASHRGSSPVDTVIVTWQSKDMGYLCYR